MRYALFLFLTVSVSSSQAQSSKSKSDFTLGLFKESYELKENGSYISEAGEDRNVSTGYGFFFEVNRIFAAPKHQALELRLGLGIALAYHFFRPFVPVSDFGQNDFEGVVVASVRNNEYQLLIPMELSYKVPLGKSYLRAMLGNQAKIPVRADIHEIFLYENFDPNSPGFEQLINPELADAAREHYSDFFRSYSVRAFTGLSIGFPKFETGIQITTTLISPFGQNQKHGKNLGFRIFVRSFG